MRPRVLLIAVGFVITAAAPAQDAALGPSAPVIGTLGAEDEEWTSPRLRAAAGRTTVVRAAFLKLGDLGPGPWTIEASSFDFDVWLALVDDEDRPVNESDDGGTATDARLVVEKLDAAATSVVIAARDGRTGEFRVGIRPGRPGPRDAKEEARALVAWVRAAADRLDAQTDPADPAAADWMQLLGRRLREAGLNVDAVRIFERAAARHAAARGEESLPAAVAADDLGLALDDCGRHPEARDVLRRCRDRLNSPGGDRQGLPVILLHLSRIERRSGDVAAAAATCEEGCRLVAAGGGIPVVLHAQLLLERSMITEVLGAGEESLRWGREATGLVEGRSGQAREIWAQSRAREALLLRKAGHFAEARSALAAARGGLADQPEGHRLRMDVAREAAIVAAFLGDATEFDDAAAEARRHLAALPGVGPADRADLLHQLGRAETELGRPSRAVGLLREAAAAGKECADPDVEKAALTAVALGSALCRSGAVDEGVAILEKERTRFEARHGAGAPDIDLILGPLAQAHLAAGRPAVARALVERLISSVGSPGSLPESVVVSRHFFLAACAAAEGDAAASRAACHAALDMGRAYLDREFSALSEAERLGFLADQR